MMESGHLPYKPIISECRLLMARPGNLVISHIYTEQNRVADLLAKEGAKKKLFDKPRILVVPPMFANDTVWADILGTTFDRKTAECNIANIFGYNVGHLDNSINMIMM
ncbi:hypothetical protein A4A49_03511 [Nicotiana attenuata]|uniref:RNase H type-1 domain-containing protein n=1 Tax=Nicotiana attenuata TaxID=49451 RepID=A0A1J6HS33_NICAT|nr:hypothetical protein A4A49_03511 [Nicotiana attenuata]